MAGPQTQLWRRRSVRGHRYGALHGALLHREGPLPLHENAAGAGVALRPLGEWLEQGAVALHRDGGRELQELRPAAGAEANRLGRAQASPHRLGPGRHGQGRLLLQHGPQVVTPGGQRGRLRGLVLCLQRRQRLAELLGACSQVRLLLPQLGEQWLEAEVGMSHPQSADGLEDGRGRRGGGRRGRGLEDCCRRSRIGRGGVGGVGRGGGTGGDLGRG
eukprot:scaffold19190_cov53-Phaeocystis_antarctica.AAC.1